MITVANCILLKGNLVLYMYIRKDTMKVNAQWLMFIVYSLSTLLYDIIF